MRRIVAASCLVLIAVSCGSGELTLTEYAEEVEALVSTMNRRLDDLDAERDSEAPTVESTQAFLNARVTARQEFLEGFRSLEPPEEAADLHTAAFDILTRLTAAEGAYARRADAVETMTELEALSATPEALAAEAVDEEAVAICQAAQAGFDETRDREIFTGVPWIPSELQEVVLVAFKCTAEERG